MTTRIQMWGDSLAIRIPRSCAEEIAVSEGSPVSIQVKNGSLVVHPVIAPVPSLTEILDMVTPENLHDETDWGAPVGREVW